MHYSFEEDLDLASHFDNAEMTLNINLGEVFEGARARVANERDAGFSEKL